MPALEALTRTQRVWLVTGGAGFIGSHLVEALLQLGQTVVVLDNLITGRRFNLDAVRAAVGARADDRLTVLEGDIRDLSACRKACANADIVLHHAALCSVGDSVKQPLEYQHCNVDGTLNVLLAARDAEVSRVVYATSSAIYGNAAVLPVAEGTPPAPLSPYALNKLENELCAGLFSRLYGLSTIGLRYFNIFGPRQNPSGGYAAVIPKWIAALIRGDRCEIYGDGEATRDFCFVDNVVQACLLAGITSNPRAENQVFNVGLGEATSIKKLYSMISSEVRLLTGLQSLPAPKYSSPRAGDVIHSKAEIRKARELLGYSPSLATADALRATVRAMAAELRAWTA